jgi:hypothetical protein
MELMVDITLYKSCAGFFLIYVCIILHKNLVKYRCLYTLIVVWQTNMKHGLVNCTVYHKHTCFVYVYSGNSLCMLILVISKM